jgi:arsenate reductase
LYTQFKENLSHLGTNGNTLPCEKVFCYSGDRSYGIIPYGSQNIGTSRIRGAPLSGKTPSRYGDDAHPIIGFSTYDDRFNPQSAFAAILTCSQADGAPFITGAEKKSQSL